jgi:hypothetical protein
MTLAQHYGSQALALLFYEITTPPGHFRNPLRHRVGGEANHAAGSEQQLIEQRPYGLTQKHNTSKYHEKQG